MNLTQQCYWRIRQTLIADQELGEGRFSINTLSRKLGMGRSPVRDAVNRLAAEGLLQTVAKSGITVREVTFEELQDIVGLREALEPFAVAQACARMDYRKQRDLYRLCREMSRLAKSVRDADFQDESLHRQLHQADWRFHSHILAASGNLKLRKIVEDHHLLLRKVRYPSLPLISHLAQTLLEHWRIYRALKEGDGGEARRWMLRHARRGGNAMLESWRQTRDHGG